ncbi:MAG: DUF1573 domain-containing protein [Bacteroidales bacterium]|nr:DUF1573 domain-containing protein [Bacteroidales bacterium]
MKTKQWIWILTLLFGLGISTAAAQSSKTSSSNQKAATTQSYNGTGAEISFAKKTIDYGTLHVGDVRVVEMVYTNIGKKPLILDNVTTNCDCTEVDWSKKPVMPGKTGVIKVTYTAKNPGLISKWVTVMSNAETDRVVLKTTGEVK